MDTLQVIIILYFALYPDILRVHYLEGNEMRYHLSICGVYRVFLCVC